MPDNLLFTCVFLSQIIVVSIWLPSRIKGNLRRILDMYPAETHPRLYPKPVAWYERALVHFAYINRGIAIIGLLALLVVITDSTNDDYAGVAWSMFMLQSVPFLLLEIFMYKNWGLMREADARKTRSAALLPRRISDVLSPAQIGALLAAFLLFTSLVTYLDQFGFHWFGGYLNVVILGGGYALLIGMVLWQLYGKKRDPYINETDHINRIRQMVRQLVFVCLAVTVYGMVTISLRAFDLQQFNQLVMSVYCQVLAISAVFTFYSERNVNYVVYRDDVAAI